MNHHIDGRINLSGILTNSDMAGAATTVISGDFQATLKKPRAESHQTVEIRCF